MRRLPPPRGLSLLELVVAMAVSAVVLAGIVGVVTAQQKAYQDGQRQRAAQSAARAGLTFMEQALVLAGYGLDAPLTFDFDRYSGPCPTEMGSCPRDAVNNSDEIVFYNRNPRYWVPSVNTADPRGNAWRVVSADIMGVTISARKGDQFLLGQILQVVCEGGARYSYATVSATTAVSADGNVTLSLAPPIDDDPFNRPDAFDDACFSSAAGPARMFLVDRHRFHVRPVLVDGAYVPYLVHDIGLDLNGDSAIDDKDEILVAEGVEILQVGYVLTNAALASRGTDPGTAIPMARGAPGATSGNGLTLLEFPGVVQPGSSIYLPTSFFGYTFGPPAASNRLTDHQGNIRAVMVSMVARSPDFDRQVVGTQISLPILNMNQLPDWINLRDRHARVRFETTVPVRNMAVRAATDS
jgi:type IV pilus assembly protein PilW